MGNCRCVPAQFDAERTCPIGRDISYENEMLVVVRARNMNILCLLTAHREWLRLEVIQLETSSPQKTTTGSVFHVPKTKRLANGIVALRGSARQSERRTTEPFPIEAILR